MAGSVARREIVEILEHAKPEVLAFFGNRSRNQLVELPSNERQHAHGAEQRLVHDAPSIDGRTRPVAEDAAPRILIRLIIRMVKPDGYLAAGGEERRQRPERTLAIGSVMKNADGINRMEGFPPKRQ